VTPVVPQDWRGQHYRRYEELAATPPLVLSVLLIPVLVIPLAVRHLTGAQRDALEATDYTIWVVFAADYVTRLCLAQRRGAFVRHNLADLLLVALPMLRPLRAARLLRLARFGRLAKLLRVVGRHSERSLHARAVGYIAVIAGATSLLAALVVANLEQDQPGATIHGFGDGIWWAFTTVSTVGYGDRYPVTPGGRAVAAALMVVGVSLFGTITASVATYFVRHVRQQPDDVTTRDLADRLDRLEELVREALAERGGGP